ncbi:protein translocase subunit SecDF [Youhaiella tibetensis]|uniref:Multifunctional fusion protein n=1 Tax=Paradevosia tibetensis TaxID=1447062 RepID=A0A5B9DQ98_9HYPH|nr:protein translocase subunit SecD [Youhaiella tibetensis]QEE20738.1 protein translocase subunit SecD [Youhaiella tibetensis]GGF21498.1 protein translocase subunit SecDF [Youhaiella tibetensis]
MQFSPIRAVIIAIVAILAVAFTIPSFLPKDTLDAMPDWMPKRTIVLGLDLQGGSHLLLGVNKQSIVDQRVKDLRRDARAVLANENGIGNIITTGPQSITVELTDPTQQDAALKALETLQNNISNTMFSVGGTPELSFSTTSDGKITVALTDEGINQRMSSLVTQSMEVIRKRVDELGTTEPSIQRQGSDRVLLQVPGFGDSTRLKDIVSKTARLTFHMVYPGMTAAQAEAQGLPAGTIILPSQDGGKELLYEDVSLGGESLVDSQPGFDQQTGRSVVTFKFDTRGAVTFSDITSKNVGKRFAIVLDNQVLTAPVIQQPITGGSGQISGNFTPQSAQDLAVLLRAGALPASLDIIEERTVGPSLGADSIRAGLIAGAVAAAAVILFMLMAYGLWGVFANISLILNIFVMLGSLSMLGATLTLPGIAGIILTIGMAVDANVLIYERIREEQQAGRSNLQAITAGFERAWGTIVDSHLTSLIAAIVLFFLGSGPVQGFAVTLALGILTSMFTAYTVTLFIAGIWYRRRRPKTVQIRLIHFIPDHTKIPFMKFARPAIIISVLAIAGSMGSFFTKGMNLGIDFTGGSAIEVQHVGGPADPGDIRQRLSELGLGEIQVQGFGTPEDVLIRVQAQEGGDAAQQAAVQKVRDALQSGGYEVRRTESVGPSVSGELAVSGAIGLGVALLAIMVYVWFRFEWQYAVGAIVSTFHDVLLTIGFFSITGIEFNLTSIAAILTIVGYSLNDTVVVYDRVRENLRKYKKMSLPELIDLSINSTLARTTLTAFTTLLALIPLVLFGGEVIRSFTISMTWGVLIGTYSSIVIAAPILIWFGLRARADQAKDEKQAKEKRADGAAV